MFRVVATVVCLVWAVTALGQLDAYSQQKFCSSLYKVFESGRMDNFDAIAMGSAKQSPLLQVPGPKVKLEGFPVVYVDKNQVFTGKSNLTLDSAGARAQLQVFQQQVAPCLDSAQWVWLPFEGDDPATVFFTESFELTAVTTDLTLALAAVKVTDKAYTVYLHIRRHKP